MELSLTKVHGSENDFFILDETLCPRSLTSDEVRALSEKICSRDNGLLSGADGILLVQEPTHVEAMAKMRVINNDGSEASMCGNGLRTVARYLAEKNNRSDFFVETMHADLKVRHSKDLHKEVAAYQVEISPVSFDAEAIPMDILGKQTIIDSPIPELSKELNFSVVAVPNPHLIAFVDHATLIGSEQERIAKMVNEANPWFPDGVNVSFVEVLAPDELFVKTYERGVGFTNACGTAMCASSLMHVLLNDGEFFEPITVKNPGGLVKTVVHQDPEGNYWMELIGNATITYKIQGQLTQFLGQEFDQLVIEETNEQQAYEDFLKEQGIKR